MNDGRHVLDASAHLLSHALFSQSASESCDFKCKADDIWKKYMYLFLRQLPSLVLVSTAVRRSSTVVPLTHGGELKNREAPVLNKTSVGKCHRKKSQKFPDFGMLDTGYHTVYTDNSADLPVPYEAIICKCC
jgi:hypothetical protein